MPGLSEGRKRQIREEEEARLRQEEEERYREEVRREIRGASGERHHPAARSAPAAAGEAPRSSDPPEPAVPEFVVSDAPEGPEPERQPAERPRPRRRIPWRLCAGLGGAALCATAFARGYRPALPWGGGEIEVTLGTAGEAVVSGSDWLPAGAAELLAGSQAGGPDAPAQETPSSTAPEDTGEGAVTQPLSRRTPRASAAPARTGRSESGLSAEKMKEVSAPRLPITVRVPTHWRVETDPYRVQATETIGGRVPAQRDLVYAAVIVDEMPPGTGIAELEEIFLDDLLDGPDADHIMVDEGGRRSFDGRPGLLFDVVRSGGEFAGRSIMGVVMVGNKGCLIDCSAPPHRFDRVESVLRAIVSSVRVKR